MSEPPTSTSPKKEVIAPPHESLRAEFAMEPTPAELSYGEARLWIIARDPHCIFAYWEFCAGEHPDAVDGEGRARFFLRLFREDGRAESSTEIENGAGNCFIHAGVADAGYYAELGFYSNHVWCFLARSKNTRTPPELPATDAPVAFVTIPATVSLGKMRDLLARSALAGESLASTAARIQADARASDDWTAEHEHLLTEFLGEASGPDLASPASSSTLVRRKLAVAAKVAAPMPPIPAPETGKAPSSAGASWPTSPGAAPR
jgi:hypothetical protein